jgi:hypothetical protein
MHGNGMCLTTLKVNLRPFLCNLPIRFDLAQAINRCINRAHIKDLASRPIPTPSVQNSRTSRWGNMARSLGVSWGFFFNHAHNRNPAWRTGLGGVDGVDG